MEIKAICLLFCLQFGDGPPAIDAARFCAVFQPIMWSSKDTRGTKEQVDILNRQWKRLCQKKP